MFEDFSGAEDKIFEQSDKKLEPIVEEIFKEAGLHTDAPPAERSEMLSAEIGELPIEMQVQAIEVCVQEAFEIVEDSKIASVLRNIIKTGLGRGLEQDLKDEIVKLAYEIEDGDLLETMLQELEDAGILVRKVKDYRGPAQEIKHVETPAEKVETPAEVVETPIEKVETPAEVVETPIEKVETPAEVVETPIEKVETPAEVVETPIEKVETPAEVVETPIEKVETPAEVVETPIEKVEVEEYDFSGETVPEGWKLSGSAKLTGDGEIDEVGEGWLRLTGNDQYESGYAFNNEALETENGLTFKFDYSSWGGNGADGITFFLVNGETELDEFHPGGVGGSLGYAPRYKSTEGMSNAYVGIGFDEFGNFSNPTEGRTGGTKRIQDSISVRGSGDGFEGYEYIDGTERLKEGIDQRKVAERPDQSSEDARHVSIKFKPIEDAFHMSLEMQFGAEGDTKELFSDLEIPGEVPETLKFGFVATTGGATNFHEVTNVSAQETVEVETVEEAPAEVSMEREAPAEKVETPIAKVETPAEKVDEPIAKTDTPASENAG